MNTSIFKAYDIRGIYPTDVNEQVATSVARACIHMFPPGEIIIAHDVRHGSAELVVIIKTAMSAEAKVVNKEFSIREIGPSSTPMFYFLVNHFAASGGIMITASHNPKNYNGMKVVKAGAEMVPGTELLSFITSHNLA